jgi:NTE family protein
MKNALILSGGGARAAYQVGVLKAVAELLPDGSANPFPIICGTSAGAINAVTLASYEGSFRDAVEALEGVWSNLEPGDVYRYGWWETFKGLARFGSSLLNQGVGVGRPIALLDNAPLRKLIKRTINFEKIDRALARGDLEAVGVTAMGYSSGHSVCFFQGQPEMEGWERHRRKGRRTLLGADHLMASSAIPAIFPTTRIEHEYYGDGALRQLAPISPALHLGADQVFIIGVSGNRDPRLENRRQRDRHSPSMGQIIGHMFNSAFVDSLESDIERLERINRLIEIMPPEILEANELPLKSVNSLVISPSEAIDRIASNNIQHLPRSLRYFLRSTGATASGSGATAASYLLFAKPFTEELISLGYRDTMWDKERVLPFFQQET